MRSHPFTCRRWLAAGATLLPAAGAAHAVPPVVEIDMETPAGEKSLQDVGVGCRGGAEGAQTMTLMPVVPEMARA